MLPTRAASAFHAAVHDLKVARLARVAKARAPGASASFSSNINIVMPKEVPTNVATAARQYTQFKPATTRAQPTRLS